MPITVALDAMSGDRGPTIVVPAALRVLANLSDVRLVLVGDESHLRATLSKYSSHHMERLDIQHASESVEMDDLPSQALRRKKDSSMRVACDLVQNGTAGACVSAGNTGALMAIARFVLKTLPGIDRPAIISALPTMTGHTHLLDLGANVDCTPRQLFEFAVMGAVLAQAVHNTRYPTVGLLNIGEEEIKGNEDVKEAAKLLAGSNLNYIGFVEGDDIYAGTADVIVCNGFVGNVALKTSEGVAKMISHFIHVEFKRNALTKILGVVAMPVLAALRTRIDPRQYNGASLLGLRGIVVKSHGSADEISFATAIREAITEIEKNVPARIEEHVGSMLTDQETT